MSQLIFGGLLTTPAPTAPIVGIAFIALFAIVGFMVGPDYDGTVSYTHLRAHET